MKLAIGHLRSNAVAYLALFIALSSTSYAAIKIPNNSVGPKQIKKNAVDGTKVKDKTLLLGDFKPGQLQNGPQGDKGDTGPQGVQGQQGQQGQKGDDGPPGTGSVQAQVFNDGSDTAQLKPAEPPDALILRTTSFTTTAANTTIVVSGSVQVQLNCQNGGGTCVYVPGVYVDGAAVPGTRDLSNSIPQNTTGTDTIPTNGVRANVGPGTHNLQVRLKQSGGTMPLTMAAFDGGNGYMMLLPQ